MNVQASILLPAGVAVGAALPRACDPVWREFPPVGRRAYRAAIQTKDEVLAELMAEHIALKNEKGNKHRSTRNRDEGRGTPQGAPISPLLSNLYMRRFVLGWKKLGHEKRLAAYIVNYADDLVICCRGRAEEALAIMRDIMTKLQLTVNETKTRVCKLPEEKFDFLGYTFGRCYSPRTGRAYIGTFPSKKRVLRICEAISEMTGRDQTLLDQETVVAKLNRTMIGWANYFCLGSVSNAYRVVENHARTRLRQWLRAKHKVTSGATRFSDRFLHDAMGLVCRSLRTRTRTLP